MYQVVLELMLGISTAAVLAGNGPAAPPAQADIAVAPARPVMAASAAEPSTVVTPRRAVLLGRTVLLGRAAGTEQLGAARGGTDTLASTAELGGEVASNTAHHLSTGANSIATGSLSGAVGLPVVIQNSGANVLIQNSTIVNVQFK